MARRRHREDEGIPPFDENPLERPSEDDEELALPRDRPLISHDRVTASDQLERESLNTRHAREEPEVWETRKDRDGLVDLSPEEAAISFRDDPDEWVDEADEDV